MITIDGSMGEGGGQILRTALALSLVTGKPFHIERIRAGRTRPGLLRQHLTAVNAAAQIGQATLDRAAIGSQELAFEPSTVRPGNYHFSVGTAGSTTLVLQAVLPALLTASAPSTLRLEGGTHNPAAPPFDFLDKTLLPLINRMGPHVNAALQRPGFYPAGGGSFTVDITPAAKLAPIDLLERGEIRARRARAIVSALPLHVAERELRVLGRKLGIGESSLIPEIVQDPAGPGNVLIVEIECEHITEVFTAFGERGVSAESVAGRVAAEVQQYLESGVPVDSHLADQLILPFALAGGGSFNTLPLSSHARTNIAVLRAFLDLRVLVSEVPPHRCLVGFRR